MNTTSEQADFLNWKLKPARLNATQAAWFLGFEPDEITILVGAGLLKPLGHPARNSGKLFATEILQQLWHDEKWLGKATDAITNYWKQRSGAVGSLSSFARSQFGILRSMAFIGALPFSWSH